VKVCYTANLEQDGIKVTRLGRVRGASVKHLLWQSSPTEEIALEQAKYWAIQLGGTAILDPQFGSAGTDLSTNTWAAAWCDAWAITIRTSPEEAPALEAARVDSRPVFDRMSIAFTIQAPIAGGGNAPEVFKAVRDSIVSIRSKNHLGTGSIISPDGYIVTASHVIADAQAIEVTFSNGNVSKASVVRYDSGLDVALLKVASSSALAHASVAYDSFPNIGDPILAIGSPLTSALSLSLTSGIVSGIRSVGGVDVIQVDAPLNRGNSGGPILNLRGQIVGIVSFKALAVGVEGLGFAVSIRDALVGLNLVPTAE
jgi:S1-C subfamily serine protease